MTSRLKSLSRDELADFLAENLPHLTEDEAVAILGNAYVTPKNLQAIAQNQRLSAFYSVRVKLVAHRQTPQAHAVKFVHYLYWPDLVRLSTDVTVPATVRRAIDTLLLTQINKLALGERISVARQCSAALIKVMLFDPDPRVFASLLINPRLREDDLLVIASSPEARPEQLTMLAADRKWGLRYMIRKSIVLNTVAPGLWPPRSCGICRDAISLPSMRIPRHPPICADASSGCERTRVRFRAR